MPSRRHNSEMFSSPRSPSSTIRIFSSAEYCRRVWRRYSSAPSLLKATTNQKFFPREVPQFVSGAGEKLWRHHLRAPPGNRRPRRNRRRSVEDSRTYLRAHAQCRERTRSLCTRNRRACRCRIVGYCRARPTTRLTLSSMIEAPASISQKASVHFPPISSREVFSACDQMTSLTGFSLTGYRVSSAKLGLNR